MLRFSTHPASKWLAMGFTASSAVTFAVTSTFFPPAPAYLSGEQTLREWIVTQTLPVLRSQSKNFVQEYSAMDKSLAQRQGPSADFCKMQQDMLRDRIKMHEQVVARDRDVDTGALNLKRLRLKQEEQEHEQIANFQQSLLLFCEVLGMERSLSNTEKQLQNMQRMLKP